MAEQLTTQQLQAVTDRGGKLLVSAAAGSGKTKVLVDRLMRYLEDPADPANIDDFLIITYTKAAAAELRGKIASKLSEKLSLEPGNRHLQQQLQRLYLTKISTVHAFCTDLLREYAYRLDISGDFRVAEENECLEMQLQVIDELLSAAYDNAANDPDFCAFVDSQGLGRDDRQVPQIILQVYNSARCHLSPEQWLDWCLSVNDISGVEDASETVWGKYLISDLHRYLDLQIQTMERCAQLACGAEQMEKPAVLLCDTVSQLRRLRECSRWDDIILNMSIDFGRLTFSKKCTDTELAERIKACRDACKKGIAKKLRRFTDRSEQILQDIAASAAAARGLISLTRCFAESYAKRKRGRRVVDFSDLEHIALDLLLGKNRTGATSVANEVGSRFREVMVDEYQDSNAVQDAIFEAITGRKQNCFMVGDVKQSIYQFRLADPGIFLEKYNSYVPATDAEPGQGRKVLLSHNFRSAGAVISAVNDVFHMCMTQSVGGLDYREAEALQEGIPHATVDEPEIELHAIQVLENTYEEEAAFVADRITELLDGTHMIREKDSLRPIRPEDIVILLRSPGSVGAVYAQTLGNRGIRCSFGGSVDILQTEEVQALRSILQAVDNPLQDIPLVAALTSRVFGFTADDLADFRSGNRGCSVYEALRASRTEKATQFLSVLDTLRREARIGDLTQLIHSVFTATRIDSIYAAMPDGDMRTENLQSFCQLADSFEAGGAKSLSRFMQYLEALDERGVPGAAEQALAGAVTIMSIHKSKGLEFPVVILSGLSREFNRDSTRAQVLCDKDLGLGLNCVDLVNRVRYPSIAKRAIAVKMIAESLSEELRVLYVAMTRPKDRLIMTYAAQNLETSLSDIVLRMDLSEPLLMTGDVDCPGKWVLLCAMQRTEAGQFFALGGYPKDTHTSDIPWLISAAQVSQTPGTGAAGSAEPVEILPDGALSRLKDALSFRYIHAAAVQTPSKLTATQLKGRQKDAEAAEDAVQKESVVRNWRAPSFVSDGISGREYGSVLHSVMQYLRFEACADLTGVQEEIQRLVRDGYISSQQAERVNARKIADFFATELGYKLRNCSNVLREFKFSILDDAHRYSSAVDGESVLLQGVVDCALIEPDGITVIDFKTDRVDDRNILAVAERYKEQVRVYAEALNRIYNMPVKSTCLYFFSAGKFVWL